VKDQPWGSWERKGVRGLGLTVRILILVTGVVLEYGPVDDVAEVSVHVDRHLVALPYKQIDEVCPLPGNGR